MHTHTYTHAHTHIYTTKRHPVADVPFILLGCAAKNGTCLARDRLFDTYNVCTHTRTYNAHRYVICICRSIPHKQTLCLCRYGGAIGLVGFDGHLNTGLTLRTIRFYKGVAEVRAGATLLYDSTPEAEEEETQLKASAFIDAIVRPGRQGQGYSSAEETRQGEGCKVVMVDHQVSDLASESCGAVGSECHSLHHHNHYTPPQPLHHTPSPCQSTANCCTAPYRISD
jgi:hypothetical protein